MSVVAGLYRRERQRAVAHERERALHENQEVLRRTRERYGALVELSPVAIIVNRNNQVEFANPAACALLGATLPEQLYGRSIFEVFHPDGHPIIKRRIRELLNGQPQPPREQKIIRLDGAIRDVEVVASTFTDEAGVAIQVIIRDITESKQREQQLEKLSRTLRALNESNEALLHAGDEALLLQQVCRIITKDCGHALVWIGFAEHDAGKSVRAVAYAGFEEGYLETLGLTWADTERGRGPTGTAIRTGKPCGCRNMLTDPQFEPWREEAKKRGYASSLVVPLISDEHAFGAITIYANEPDPFSADEVTLLEELAADLSFGISSLRLRVDHERIAAELRRSEEHLRVAVEAGKIGIWSWDPASGDVVVSANWKEMFGVSAESCSFDTWRGALHPDDREPTIRALMSAKGKNREYSAEYRVVWPSGEIRWVADRGRAVYDQKSVAISMSGVNVDTTERKRAEAALLQSEKLASVGRMAASIAHEINNPLAAVMNTLFLAQANTDVPDSARQYLQMADEEVRRVSHITRQVLGFYREATEATTVSIGFVLDSAVEVLKSRIKAKKAVIKREYDHDLNITAVGGELRQVFCNLIANGLDAIEPGKTITIRAKGACSPAPGEPAIRITVADNGKGVEASARAHIFEALFTTKHSTGTGLGLWVAKQIVQKHGGSIRFRSSTSGDKRGTVFSIVLPAAATQQKVEQAKA